MRRKRHKSVPDSQKSDWNAPKCVSDVKSLFLLAGSPIERRPNAPKTSSECSCLPEIRFERRPKCAVEVQSLFLLAQIQFERAEMRRERPKSVLVDRKFVD